MLRVLSCITTFLLFLGSAIAQDRWTVPDQKITGGEQPIPLGDVVFLSLSKIDKAPDGYVKHSVSWKVIDGNRNVNFRVMEDGSIFFGSGIQKRKITVIASVGYLFGSKKETGFDEVDVKSVILSTVVQIGDGNIPDPVDPVDPDEPSFPPGKFGLSKKMYDLAKSKVTLIDRVGSKSLAESFRKSAKEIKDKKLTKIEDIAKMTTLNNRKALEEIGMNRDKWVPFFDDFSEILYKLYEDKKLIKPEDFITAWEEIADGLQKVPSAVGNDFNLKSNEGGVK
jgi:hypothetical protein